MINISDDQSISIKVKKYKKKPNDNIANQMPIKRKNITKETINPNNELIVKEEIVIDDDIPIIVTLDSTISELSLTRNNSLDTVIMRKHDRCR